MPAKKKNRKHAQSESLPDVKKKKTRSRAIIGFIVGLLGLIVAAAGFDSFSPGPMIIVMIIAITGGVLSVSGLKGKKKGLAIAGLVIAAIAVAVSFIGIIIGISDLNSSRYTPETYSTEPPASIKIDGPSYVKVGNSATYKVSAYDSKGKRITPGTSGSVNAQFDRTGILEWDREKDGLVAIGSSPGTVTITFKLNDYPSITKQIYVTVAE
jgi:lysylphosphatidylglycerol synthetase-like protein (DUF2156 family)